MFVLKVVGTLSLHSRDGAPPPEALQKKRLGLLALLAIAGDRGIARDTLQTFLWPESDSARARHALDQLVYATRRALGVNPFLSEGHDLRLDPDVVDSDIRQFREGIQAGDFARAVGDAGGTLLEGFHLSDSGEMESWIESHRARLRSDYQTALATLATNSQKSGESSAALAWRRKLAESDPLSSRFAADVIRAMVEANDRPAALQYATRYTRLVKSELGVEPDPEIRSLAASLLLSVKTGPLTPRDTQASPAHVVASTAAPPHLTAGGGSIVCTAPATSLALAAGVAHCGGGAAHARIARTDGDIPRCAPRRSERA